MSALSSQVEAVGSVFLARRPLVVGPLAGWTVLVLFLHDVPVAQRAVVAVGMTLGLALFTVEAVIARRRRVTERWLFVSLLVTLAAVSAVTTVLGGLNGPFLPMLFAPAGVGFAAFGVTRRGFILWAAMSGVLLGLLAAPAPFSPLEALPHRLLAVAAASASVLLLLLGVGGLSSAYVRASEQVVAASDEVVNAAHARVRAVEELTGHFAHELKNPLSVLKGVVQLLEESVTDARSRRRVELATTEVARMEKVLRDGLDFTRPVTPARRSELRLDELLRSVAAIATPQAERRGVQLSAVGAPLTGAADAELLKSALLNLALNALEATPPGGQVSLSWRPEGADVLLVVKDTGRGMNAKTLARIGEPFFTTREEGTGLGVALARQVASQHGGTLTFVSTEGQGTTATLRLGAPR